VLGTVEFKRDRLINRDSNSFRCGIPVVSNVDGDRLSLHAQK
jgi:hypothetical protein